MDDDMPPPNNILALDAVRATEAAACAASRFLGCGDDRAADQAAVNAMHDVLMDIAMDGTVRIGEGSGPDADKLYLEEKLGNGRGPMVDIALMALEGPSIIAKGGSDGLSTIAMTRHGGFLNAPDMYMEKIAVGGGLPDDIIDLDEEPSKNIGELARAKGIDVGDLVVCILDRPRHSQLITKVREAGCRLVLIPDGDVSGVIATIWPDSGIDIYMGIGGASQGVLSAAALGCVGGQMQCRLVFRNDDERLKADECGIKDHEQKFSSSDMAKGDVIFAATGVTGGAILPGVHIRRGYAVTKSLVMNSRTGTLRLIETHHRFGCNPARSHDARDR